MPALSADRLAADPIDQFSRWFRKAFSSGERFPDAVALATAGRQGRATARVVLLKGFDAAGFVFYTNYRSRKARELARHPYGALLFHWPVLARQVRIEGRIVPVSPAESDIYFATRPRGSQLGAWASAQSREIPDRLRLTKAFNTAARRYPDAVPRPPHWGGYRLEPDALEFWQGRPDRLHDRFVYRRRSKGGWRIARLAP
jgi:pyridoxamine 5'-phosphate oxidase